MIPTALAPGWWPSRRLRTGMAAAWTVLILALCLMPANWLGLAVVEQGYFRIPIPSPDKLVHFTLFAGFSALWIAAGWPRRAAGLVVTAGLALAVFTELAQNLPAVGRDGNLLDTLADTLGVLGGGWIAARALPRIAPTAGDPPSPKKLADS